ncbi:MAG TPA: nuclear transport factor 2 family protein [Chloroflexota bacterium]|nr:nuclear transport factor 2 family protein [Chloroflexota bacterium]
MASQPRRDVADLLRRVYAAFNRRDIDAALATAHADVDWPNVLDGVRLHGRAQVRAYWARQFATFDPRVEPSAMSADEDERISVDVHQVTRSLDGTVLSDITVKHVYTLRDGLIARMDVLPAAGAGPHR